MPDICGRVRAAGIPAQLIAGNDIVRMHEQATKTIHALRSGQTSGPFFFECETYRWKEHVGPNEDYHLGYRDQSEARPWIDEDQLTRLKRLVPEDSRQQVEAEVEKEIRAAIRFAEESPFPDGAELTTDVFSTPATTSVDNQAA